MPVIKQRIQWTKQPQYPVQLDRGNQLTPNLGVWMPTHSKRNLVTGVLATDVNGGPSVAYGNNAKGWSATGQTLTTTNGIGLNTGLVTNPSQLTFFCDFVSFDAPSSGSAFGMPFGRDQYGINWHHSNATYRGAVTLHIGASYPAVTLTDKVANKRYTIVGTWDGTTLKAFQNGVFVGSTAAIGSLNTLDTNGLSILVGSGNRYPLNGNVYLAGISSIALTDSAAMELSRNPWQIFAP